MYSFQRFKKLPTELQLEQLTVHGVVLGLVHSIKSAEAVLYAYHDFYVELVVVKHTDEMLSLRCFKTVKKLAPYLEQVDISEITALLACSQ